MKGLVFSAWFAVVVVCAALAGCGAGSVSVQGKAPAPTGSWKGGQVTVDLGSDGRASYKSRGVADITGRWEWAPSTQDQGVVVLTSSTPGSANRFPITWLNKNELRFCDANGHCDTLSRR